MTMRCAGRCDHAIESTIVARRDSRFRQKVKRNCFAGCGLRLLTAVCLWINPLPVFAHPEGFSGLHVTIEAGKASAALTLHTRDLGTWLPPDRYPNYVSDICQQLEKTVEEIVELQLDGVAIAPTKSTAFLVEAGLIEVDVNWRLPYRAGPSELLVWSKQLNVMPQGHQQLLFIEDRRQASQKDQPGKLLLEDILTVDRDAGAAEFPPDTSDRSHPGMLELKDSAGMATAESKNPATDNGTRVPLRGSPGDRPHKISFLWLGIEHILTGYDHLLFLAALLLTTASLSEAGKIVTCFTVAHSITLALAVLDVVQISAEIVEPAIAASIVYAALENLWATTPALWRRLMITFVFGLIHGLGFASVLKEIGLGAIPGGVAWPLLRFNFGVEIGQLCVASAFFMLLRFVARRNSAQKTMVRVGSLLIAVCGTYWLVVRTTHLMWDR